MMKVAALARMSLLSVSKPIIVMTFSTPGSSRIRLRNPSATSSVRGKADPSGRRIAMRTMPWSSRGMNAVGVRSRSCQPPAQAAARRSAEITRCLSARRTRPRNRKVKRASAWLKSTKTRAGSPFAGLSRSAQSAGVSVRATKPEITTETAIVTANCR